MIAKVYSAIPYGYEGRLLEIEGDTNQGLPSFNIVGMANKTISEARERVRAALANSGFLFPQRKVTINLAPAELAKDGSHLDLPIALAILILSEQILPTSVAKRLFVGELSLNGDTKPVRGIINIVETAVAAGFTEVFLPAANYHQAKLAPGIKITPIQDLKDLYLHLHGLAPQPTVVKNTVTDSKPTLNTNFNHKNYPSLSEIQGQSLAKRALTIAVAGHHNLLLTGPPGTGKTLLAKAALSLLPPPSPPEQTEITKIHSLSPTMPPLIIERPFRSPHHSASITSIIGGGPHVSPGEISLAHRGVLFLDEFPEFPRNVIESLRQPLEDHQITITRANQQATYPANFMLIATMNPCPCGHLGDPDHPCTCSATQIQNYQKRLSGPILDRIDLVVQVEHIKANELTWSPNVVKNTKTDTKCKTKSTAQNVVKNTQTDLNTQNVKNTITEVHQIQFQRYGSAKFNSDLTSAEIQHYIHLNPKALDLLRTATDRLHLSTRSYFKTIKIAQTIADLDHSTEVKVEHISEALTFRQRTP